MPAGVSILVAAAVTIVSASIFRISSRSYPDKNGIFLRILCSVLFSAVAVEFLLILCEVLQAGDHSVRANLWSGVTALLLGILVLIAPFVQIARFVLSKYPRLKLLIIPVFCLYLILFRMMSIQLPIERYTKGGVEKDNEARGKTNWFLMRQDSLACISFIGITTMAFLCGISSVSAPYSAFFSDHRQVTEVDSDRLRQSLESINEMITAKELEISRIRLDVARNKTGGSGDSSARNSGPTSGTSTPMKSTGSSFSLTKLVAGLVKMGDSKQAQMRSLMVELDALVSLKAEVESDLNCVLEKLEQQRYQKTFIGKIHRIVFSLFAIYCIYRVFNTYLRMCWWFFTNEPQDSSRGGPRDALVLLIAASIVKVFPDIGIDTLGWSRIIGVIMSGCVFIAALNGVLQNTLKLRRLLRKSQKSIAQTEKQPVTVPPAPKLSFDLLLVGQVVGVYILSIATTLRFNLPRSMSGPIMAALVSPLKVTSVQLWNDTVLCLTSTIVLVIIVSMDRLSSDTLYDEEKGEL